MVANLAGPSHPIVGVRPVVLGPAGTRLLLVEFISAQAVLTVLENYRKFKANMPFVMKDGNKGGEAERIYAALAAQQQARNNPPVVTAPRVEPSLNPSPPVPPPQVQEEVPTLGDSWDDDDVGPDANHGGGGIRAVAVTESKGGSEQTGRWGHSVLKGRLAARTKPLEEAKAQPVGTSVCHSHGAPPSKPSNLPSKTKDGKQKKDTGVKRSQNDQGAFGVPRESNPWEDLVSSEDEEEESGREGSSRWICGACTYSNDATVFPTHCEICLTGREVKM